MKNTKLVLFTTVFVCCALFASCSGGGSNVQSGFRVFGEKYVQVFGGGPPMFVAATSIQGNRLFDYSGATGSVSAFGPLLCLGPCPIEGGRAPARWNIVAGTPGLECIGYLTPNERDVTLNSLQTSKCLTFGIVFPFTAAPSLVDLQAPPATLVMTGESLTTTYGMPYIEYRDPYTGNLIGATSATYVSAKGSVLEAAAPNLSSVYDGVYNVLISNIRADGSLEPVGSSTISCTGRPYPYEPPPDPGPCGCPPDQPCMPCENPIQ
ncbi:MAG TPA: hypothetical protein VHQ94_05685 [Pyrinomonadaceae bacterium]|jgi:hypothetical protein|nr:hypothetical protein [Pyrinomonadaceae bacterium]